MVCLLLICCLTFHAMIPKAEATSVAVPLIQKAAVVTGNPFVITAAVLITLGITAYGVESGSFETVANNCVDALEAAGTWIKDGAMELLRTEDADGNASYYVDCGIMESLRGWVYDTEIVTSLPMVSDGATFTVYDSYTISITTTSPISFFLGRGYTVSSSGEKSYGRYYLYAVSSIKDAAFTFSGFVDASMACWYDLGSGYYAHQCLGPFDSSQVASSSFPVIGDFLTSSFGAESLMDSIPSVSGMVVGPSYDLTLGHLPSQSTDLTDGTSARQEILQYL